MFSHRNQFLFWKNKTHKKSCGQFAIVDKKRLNKIPENMDTAQKNYKHYFNLKFIPTASLCKYL